MARFLVVFCLMFLPLYLSAYAEGSDTVCPSKNEVSQNLKGKTLLYLVQPSVNALEELWAYDFGTNTSRNMNVEIPELQVALDLTGNTIAYLTNSDDNSSSQQINTEIKLINLSNSEVRTLFHSNFDQASQNLHWLDETHISFMRHSQTEIQYTVLDVDGNFENFSVTLPKLFDGINWWFEFSPNFKYAAYFNPKAFDQIVQFMDLKHS